MRAVVFGAAGIASIPDTRSGLPSPVVNFIWPWRFRGSPLGIRSPHLGFMYLRYTSCGSKTCMSLSRIFKPFLAISTSAMRILKTFGYFSRQGAKTLSFRNYLFSLRLRVFAGDTPNFLRSLRPFLYLVAVAALC